MNLKDLQGKPIEPGVRVAYNLSGSVALGTIESISAPRLLSSYNTYHVIFVRIRYEQFWKNFGAKGGVSKVKVVVSSRWPEAVDKITVI